MLQQQSKMRLIGSNFAIIYAKTYLQIFKVGHFFAKKHCHRTVVRKFSIGGLCVCAGGLDIKLTKIPLILFHVSIWGCLELYLGG